MNILDIIIIVTLVVMFFTGYLRGFIKTLFDLVSIVLTFLITYTLYPYVSKFIMTKTDTYKNLSESISKTFNFDKLLEGAVTKEAQFDAIGNLPLPLNFKEMLTSNNNPEMFKLLNVSSFTEYVSSSLATIVVNVIVFLVLFLIIYTILTILVNMLNLLSKLPGLNQVNKLSGAALGLLMGLILVFVALTILSIIISTKNATTLVELIDQSTIASFLFYNNPFMDFLDDNISNNYFWNIIAK